MIVVCVWNGLRAPECSAGAEARTSRGSVLHPYHGNHSGRANN